VSGVASAFHIRNPTTVSAAVMDRTSRSLVMGVSMVWDLHYTRGWHAQNLHHEVVANAPGRPESLSYGDYREHRDGCAADHAGKPGQRAYNRDLEPVGKREDDARADISRRKQC